MYLERFPRRIIVDQTGEWIGKADADCDTVDDAVNAIRTLAPRGKWTVTVALDSDEFPSLVHWLIPIPRLDASPVRAVGGAILLVDEVDLVAPQGPPSKEIRTLYRRSRHVGLSVVSATQRPGNASREVSAQSQHVIAHYLSEPRDRDYIADVMRWDRRQVSQWLEWCRKHPHGAAWKDVQAGRLLWLPESGPPRSSPGSQLSMPLAGDRASGE